MCAAACYDFLIEGQAREVGSIKTKVQAEAPLVNEATAWESVLQRDASADDRFLYAVTTTGIYCRPSCPSRRPKRDNVAFFSSAAAAEDAGFRACQRCRPNHAKAPHRAVERAREYIDTHIADLGEERITLELLGEQSGLSPYHLQRKFKEIVGLTPAQYIRARKSERLKGELKRGETVSRATFGAGYGSSSRVYGDSDKRLGMTPATYRRGGAGANIEREESGRCTRARVSGSNAYARLAPFELAPRVGRGYHRGGRQRSRSIGYPVRHPGVCVSMEGVA